MNILLILFKLIFKERVGDFLLLSVKKTEVGINVFLLRSDNNLNGISEGVKEAGICVNNGILLALG